jgi:hypothetical protein
VRSWTKGGSFFCSPRHLQRSWNPPLPISFATLLKEIEEARREEFRILARWRCYLWHGLLVLPSVSVFGAFDLPPYPQIIGRHLWRAIEMNAYIFAANHDH